MSRISVIVKQSCTSAQSMSPGPTPAIAYARCEAMRVTLISVKLSFSCRYGWSVATPNPATYTGLSVNSRARSALTSSTAAAPSVWGQQSSRCKRMAHRCRLQDVVDGDLVLEVRVRIARAVVVVLHRDRCEHLAGRAELVHVPGRERREQHRRGLAPREDRVSGRRARQEPFLRRLVAHLLDADDQHDVVDAARHRHRADAEGVGTRRARVLDARARDAGEADGRRNGVAADALLPPQRSALRRDERGLDLVRFEALVDARDRGLERARGHLLVALLEQLTHLDEPGTDDCDPVPTHATTSFFARALKP